jgi:hypothetical protein
LTAASDIEIGTESDLGTYIDALMDHKNTIFYESGVPYPPIALAKGDLWYDLDSVPKKIYRASAPGGTNWVDVTTDVLAEALAKAEAARGLADTKALVFIQNDPPTQGMENGDLWVDADGGRLVYVYNNGWQALKSNGAITNSIVLDDNGILVKSGGNVKIQANGNFDVDSGGAVRINAGDGVDSYIRLGQGNFSASRDGGVVAEMGSFNQNLSVRGKEVWSKFNLIVSASQPTGNGIIWLQPNATSSVVYSLYTGPNRSIYWSNATPSRGFALDAESSSAVLANGTFKYRLKIVFYETLENRTNVSINAVLTKGGNTVNLGTYVLPSIRQWEEKTVELEVQSDVNLCGDTTDINLTVNAAPGSSGGFFLQRYNYITLTVTNIASSGSAQACNVFWLP